MRRLLLILTMASTMSTLSAQQAEIVENVEKTQYENTSYLVVGSLVLKPGFNFNSASQGSFYARAYDNDPTVAPSENRGFARTEQVYIEGILTDDQVIPLGVDSKSISFSYFDGIGRHTQSVQVQGSPGGSDLVQPVTYDVKQRPSISYLPYSSQGNTGTFRTGAIAEQGSFYTAPPPGITSDTKAYSNATYEDSPLDRVTEISNTGNDFQQVYATSRAKVNISGDAVRRWDIGSGRPNSTSPYPANSLSVAETTDPSGHITRTFSDFAGRTILSRTQSGTSSWFDTYYVYNDYSELLFVIPPQSSTTLAPSQAHVDLWHFQYEYDEFGRTTGTKAPGTDWLYTIYDRWDRPVLTQDGVQRAKSPAEWSYIKYDIHNRPVIIGTIANGTAIATLRTQVAASTALRFESRNTTSPLAYSIGSSYPTNANEAGILSITYYDDYGFRTNTGWASGTGNSNGLYAFSAEAGYFTLQDQNTAVKGLVTGSKSRRQGNNTDWINSVTYYDKYYQPIQSISTHQMQGTVKTSTLYAFSGEIQKTVNTYTHTGGPTKVERRFTYDHAGRPLKVYHKIDSNAEVMLSHFQYNELGEAMDIIHHSRNDGNTWLYKTGLKSTIQGWTDEILYSYQNGDPVFRQKLDYNKASGTSNATRHDGMITSNQWKHYGSGEPERVYNYTYDTPKRLTASTYREKTTSWVSNNLYTENDIVYSANGNITALKRNRDNSNSAVQMDVLSYSYNGNQLTGVADTAPAAHKAEGFNDGNSGTDYTYNGNGFIISDANKGISSIIYTISDKPQRINFSAGPNIRYTYSGGGNLITVSYHSTTNGPATKTIEYVGELVFEDDVLTEIRHEYGRVLANAGNRYQYYLTDHLGNTRVVLQEDPANFTLLATFEPDNIETESMQFMDYSEAPHIASSLFDHTETSDTGHALRLTNGETGPSRSVAVLPGDTVRMEVFGKYLDLSNKKTDPVLMALSLAMAAANPAASDIDGNLPTASSRISGTEQGLSGLLVGKERQNEAPPAYLNYLFFDKEMNYKYGGYTQMTEAAYEDGTDKTHERLYQEVVAEEAGYFYIYLSNDGTEGGEAFFDDFSIFTLESYIVQQTDYYPYGLVARNFVRAGEKETKELFQGKTYDELTGWYDFHARQYDAAVGRWFGVDPQNQFASPYLAMGNNPVMGIDPDGEFGFVIVGLAVFNAIRSGIQANNNGGNFWGAAGKSLAFSALNAAISGGIGGIFGDLGATQILGSKLLGEVGRAGTHALAGGALSSLGGGDFKSGAAASFFGSLAGSGLGASGAKGGLMIGGAALIGGTSSSIAGGDFWNGAVQSGIMATANHVRHKMIESGKIGGTLLIDKQVNPPGFDFTDYKELLQNRLIGEGFNPKTRVVDNSIGNSLSAWWRGSPTGKVTIKNYYSSRDTRTGQAFAELGDPNSAVLYNELGPARTGKVLPTWRYVNATIHEVGHTLFSFDDTNSGIMSKFDASRNPYSSFSQIQRDFILGSKWGR